VYGVDYYETFAPVAKLASFRLILAIAARNGWSAETFDFNSAYLNSKLDEEVYLEQPPDHEFADRRKYVLKLLKALYGLKQGGRKWYETLSAALADLGFTRAEADYGVFFKRDGTHLVILAIHVDDCLITGSSTRLLAEYKRQLAAKYKLTDLGPVSWLLGIKVSRDLSAHTLALSQHAYIEAIITRFNFDDLKPISTPMDPTSQLSKSQCPESAADVARMRRVPYKEAIGSLMYAAMGTRPDIAFAVSTLAQFSQNPGWVHWEAVKRVFRYLLGTKTLSLIYGGGQRGLEGYVDADGASQEHRRAITGYVFLVDGGAISWSSKKQELVTLSTAESEYVAATHAAKEAIWLRRLIGEVFRPLSEPTTLHSDSQSAIALTVDGSYHARTKHIDIRYHFIRYSIDAGSIRLLYCPTADMTADVLTKALPSVKVKHFATALGLASA
ncbi:Retrovirus-related Pol polyprotein from transposon TNT 1-94, partial [Trametes pubescens]